MSGYYTQKREISPFTQIGRATRDGLPYLRTSISGSRDVITGKQSTTSFRTEVPTGGEVTQSYAQLLRSNKRGSIERYDNGHEFYTEKLEAFHTPNNVRRTTLSGRVAFEGPVYIMPWYRALMDSDTNHLIRLPSWNAADYGNKAIALTNPVQSEAGLSTFLGEFARDGLPAIPLASFASLMQNRTDFFRNLGGEYLNLQFGWTPFLKDLEKFLNVVKNSYTMLEQYKRDSGRIVRRSYYWPEFTSTQTLDPYRFDASAFTSMSQREFSYTLNANDPVSNIRYDSISNMVQHTQNTYERVYFKGAYTYYLPTDENFISQAGYYASLADKLLGLKLTPEVLWNLSPWSWLLDWFVNIGSNISVYSAFQKDNLVLQYGYIMRHVRVSRVYTTAAIRWKQDNISPTFTVPRLAARIRKERKERIQATPYGFGLSTDAFTDVQWAILGALGASNSKERLRSR